MTSLPAVCRGSLRPELLNGGNRVEANAHNAAVARHPHRHINHFLVRTGLRSGGELQLLCFTAVRAEIALMSGGAFSVTHLPLSSATGGVDRNRSHWGTSKTPSYTKAEAGNLFHMS
jgi:hypothetical protein